MYKAYSFVAKHFMLHYTFLDLEDELQCTAAILVEVELFVEVVDDALLCWRD